MENLYVMDIKSFFFLVFFIYSWFPNCLKLKRSLDFVIKYFYNSQEPDGREEA